MKKPVAYFFLLAQLIPGTVFAGDYEIVRGYGREVCEAFLKNLNSFPQEPPMVCERKLNPKFPEFTRPDWHPLDPLQYRELVRQIDRQIYRLETEEQEKKFEKMSETLERRVQEKHIMLSIAQFDIDMDNVPDYVLRVEYGIHSCDATDALTYGNPGGVRLFILTADQSQIDLKRTNLVLPVHFGRPELFIYKGQTYLSIWSGGVDYNNRPPTLEGGQILIYTPVPLPGRQPCTYDYARTSDRRQP